MNKDQAYAQLIQRIKDHAMLGSCSSVLGWDERTYMPHQGSAHRAEQMALLARMAHEMLTAPQIGELLVEIESSPSPWKPEDTRAINVREVRRAYNRAVKLP